MSELFPLPAELLKIEDLCLVVSLVDIAPPGGLTNWPHITHDRLKELLSSNGRFYMIPKGKAHLHRDLMIKVVPSELGFNEENFGGPFETSQATVMSINDLLIQEGLAIADQ
ncbi:hypothetical protein SK128_013546 [Halocaridina rubra]|uniref:Uncharacterized protein n=1 Tax=Halocaridina rubra TaxID=373956 RepID=A0AAN8WU39_HALRR